MKLNKVAFYSKISLILLGLSVLLGYILHRPGLVQILPGMVAMVPNTALNFVILGSALLFSWEKGGMSALIKVILLLIVGTIGVLGIIDNHIPYQNLGLNYWLSSAWVDDPNPVPGRMAPASSITFILSALAAALLPFGKKRFIGLLSQLFIVAILFISILSLLIYSLKWEFIFNWYNFTRMAAHTAVGFILVSLVLGINCAQAPWYRGFYEGQEDKKIMFVTGIILLFITLVSGIGSVSRLTYLNIRTVQQSLEFTLKNKALIFTEVINSIQYDIDKVVKNYLIPNLNSETQLKGKYIRTASNLLLSWGFNNFQFLNTEGKVVYATANFNQNYLMEVPLNLPFQASLLWDEGFWFKTKIPLYTDPDHVLKGYLVIERFLPSITKDYKNYDNLGATGEMVLCYHSARNKALCFPTRFSPKKNIFVLERAHNILPVSFAFDGQTGTANAEDYDGDNVIAAYTPLKSLDLGMVLKIHSTEIYKPIRYQLEAIIAKSIILIIIGLLLLRWQVMPLVRKVVSSEKLARKSKARAINSNRELTRRNKEIQLLRDLSSALQSCLSLEEAYVLVLQYGKQLLPHFRVAFYSMHASRNYLESLLEWGNPLLREKILRPDDCWALRKGKLHKTNHSEDNLVCPHSKNLSTNPSSLCIPLLAQNDLIGLLYIEWDKHIWTEQSAEQLDLAVTFSEQMALSISNIKLRETLRNQSIRDKLTGLYNRRYLEETADREINRLKRTGASLALFMIDIDHFKYFNDTFGHDAGDCVLQALGQTLGRFSRGSDIACRFGGEEFVLILLETGLEAALIRAEELQNQVRALHVRHKETALGPITLSIGIAIYPEHGQTQEELIHNADLALYQAKNNGRNQVVVFKK